jgi:hypothetical protein
MMTPSVHSNGTSKDVLLEQQGDAASALEDAIHLLQAAQPNARDYTPQGADAFAKANAEHVQRLAKLEGVLGELMALSVAIDEQAL